VFEADLLRFADGGRLAADGVPFEILHEAVADVQGGRSWRDVWEEVSDRLEAHAEEAQQRGAVLSAAELLWQAALAAHVSQLHSYEDLARRERAEERRRVLYQRAIVSQPVPGHQIALACAGIETSGYLRLPPQTRPSPCLILLGGLDSTKEESLRFENYCLARGLATFVFDGPGQGETRPLARLGTDFLAWINEAVAIVGAHPDIDHDRIGILGRSLGGHYALRAAADVSGIRCCVAWSPLGDCNDWDSYPEAIKWGFRYAVGMPDMRETRKTVEAELVLGTTLSRINVPTLVTHGRRDAIVPPEQQDQMRASSADSVHYEMVSAGNHCCHNLAFLIRPMMADWAAAQLRAPAPEAD
jgi:2,6-dihydroxypseudooxynicotine hydrolase